MAVPVQNVSAPGFGDAYEIKTDTRAMTVATALFFMVGFLTCLNDIIIPHLKSIFELNYHLALLVQVAFFASYFVFSYPSGLLVEWLGYKRGMVVGLLVMAAGAGSFVPAAYLASFPVFLIALVILAAGMTTVQVAVNPYVTVIGPAATASSRLNLAQAFNSVGTFIAPFFGGLLILGGATELTPERMHMLATAQLQAYRVVQANTVRLPYIGIALTLVLLAIALGMIKLKSHTGVSENTQDFRPGAFAEAIWQPDSIWRHPWVFFGALGIFTYVGAEVSIGSLLVNYMGLPQIAGLREQVAANYLMVYWGGAMAGRFVGWLVLRKVRTGPVLGTVAVGAFCLVVTSILTHGHVAMFSLLFVGFCNSIMFPSIFTLGIQDLGALTSKGSSILIAAIVGGAVIPFATGYLADHWSLQSAFVIPAICYIYIAGFGIASMRRPAASDSIIPRE